MEKNIIGEFKNKIYGGNWMITIFNRKELLITMDMKRQSDVRDILSANNIKYIVKVTNLQKTHAISNSRARSENFGIKQEYSYEYKIFVHKNDYDKAIGMIR